MKKAICLAAALASCSGNVPANDTKTEIAATTTVRAAVGKEFTIAIAANPTTGYMWQFAKPLDEKIVKLVGSTYQHDDHKNMVGSGGHELWTFKATGKGKTTIEMKYVRSWEKDQPPIRVATYNVEVN